MLISPVHFLGRPVRHQHVHVATRRIIALGLLRRGADVAQLLAHCCRRPWPSSRRRCPANAAAPRRNSPWRGRERTRASPAERSHASWAEVIESGGGVAKHLPAALPVLTPKSKDRGKKMPEANPVLVESYPRPDGRELPSRCRGGDRFGRAANELPPGVTLLSQYIRGRR